MGYGIDVLVYREERDKKFVRKDKLVNNINILYTKYTL